MQSRIKPIQRARATRIDVHAHFLPHDYRQAALAAGHQHPDGMPYLPDWSEADALELMDALSIRTAMLSISSPGVHFGNDIAARSLARSVNEQGAELVRSRHGRFGLFAALPLPDVAGSISEAIHALDDLGADGVTMETNHGGLYLGDPALDPLMQLLDRRRAVVFVHPTSVNCAGCLSLAFNQPRPVVEFMFETTRAVTNVLYNRTLRRFPGIRMILPHAGAALPVFAARIADQAHNLSAEPPLSREEVYSTLKKLHYDLAGSPMPTLARALLDIADPERIHYGSDWPFTPAVDAVSLADEIEVSDLFDDDLRRRIFIENSLDLFPRLKSASS